MIEVAGHSLVEQREATHPGLRRQRRPGDHDLERAFVLVVHVAGRAHARARDDLDVDVREDRADALGELLVAIEDQDLRRLHRAPHRRFW